LGNAQSFEQSLHGRHGGARLGCYNRHSLRLRREGEAS
jgi:hypothetical protein